MAVWADESRRRSEWWRQLTIVVPTSPVQSNPSTATLRAVFASFALVPELPRSAKLVQFDGPQRELSEQRIHDYGELERRVRSLAGRHPDFAATTVRRSSAFLFAAHNLAAAVEAVNTSFMLVREPAASPVAPLAPPAQQRQQRPPSPARQLPSRPVRAGPPARFLPRAAV